MKKLILGAVVLGISGSALAQENTGPGCGWGAMLFEGQSGIASHVVAATTNGFSGNNTFGMTTGTNGCDTSKKINYAGASKVVFYNMDRLSNDIAKGEGEILSTLAAVIGVREEDKTLFQRTLKQNFSRIYPNENTTSQQVVDVIFELMAENSTLAKYV